VTEERELDVVIFGATGFVGRLVAEYLAGHAGEPLRLGLAGRSGEKLERLRADLGESAADLPLVVADSSDSASLAAMARRTKVVATTVGPYHRSGIGLVEACIGAGTDYADLTGEVLFVHECMERHDRAVQGGARIVHSCGFDSIPSDMGVYLPYRTAAEDSAGELGETTYVVTGLKGGVSGGTVASLKGQIDEARESRAARRLLMDPYALTTNRDDAPKGDDEGDLRGVKRDADLGQWVGPFVMAPYNTRIVRRSNALQDWAYGRALRYREVVGLGDGPTAPVKGAALAGGLGALTAGLALPPTRKVLDRLLPDPGEGPSEKTRREGFFRVEIHTRTSRGARYVAKVAAQGDPGYGATAMLMGEAARCLALDDARLPMAGGVLTPAAAMGDALVARLREGGMTLEVERRS
jgi:short subunit dehydrogenase-like uncharacterized protein